ncbi:MAG: hypothetical protein HY909_12760 [Deltaproteobacteria bacterium]|nr:hypothetical protein [Deltaproteobacteria bacterium]
MAGRVLLVEHDDSMRVSIVRAMRARGIGVDAFTSAAEALTAVKAGGTWTRALIDLNLPELDGASLAEELLAWLPALEVSFAAGGVDAAVLCRAHGLGTVLWKPLGLGPLCERFGQGERHQSGTQLRRVSSVEMPAVKMVKSR